MFCLDDELNVYVHSDAVDFRKSINGLAAIAQIPRIGCFPCCEVDLAAMGFNPAPIVRIGGRCGKPREVASAAQRPVPNRGERPEADYRGNRQHLLGHRELHLIIRTKKTRTIDAKKLEKAHSTEYLDILR
jgi:hypothetical protein